MVVLFSITQYINSSKDTSIKGNLSILSASGEVYYNNYGDTYDGFCTSAPVKNAFLQMPHIAGGESYCAVNPSGDAWAACSRLFIDNRIAYCVDSRGVQREICNDSCDSSTIVCPEKIIPCP